VEEAVADGVGQRGLAEVIVPLGGRQLARDDRGAAAVAIFEDLEQIPALLILDRRQAPVVEDEDVEAGELREQADVGAVGPGQGEVMEEAGGAPVVGAIALAAGLMRQRAGEETLARASRNSNILRSFRARSSSTTAGIRCSDGR